MDGFGISEYIYIYCTASLVYWGFGRLGYTALQNAPSRHNFAVFVVRLVFLGTFGISDAAPIFDSYAVFVFQQLG